MTDSSSVFAAIAAVAAAASAVISLCQQITAKKTAAAIRKINNETLWYNKIALDTIVVQLNEFVDCTERNIEACKKNRDEISTLLKKVNMGLNSDINSLNELFYLLKIFDVDLFRICSNKLEEIRDIYSRTINNSLEAKRLVYYQVNVIHAKKKEIVEELWKYAKIVTG